jgi:serine/arginine repetitive matrix protein 2
MHATSTRPLLTDSIHNRIGSAITTSESRPTIRLVSATPFAIGEVETDANNSVADASFASSYVSVSHTSSPLAPRTELETGRRKVVPKKSKLGILGGSSKLKTRAQDMSDIVRRVGGDANGSGSNRAGFDIYVDPKADSEPASVVLVKKKKSRGALNALGWGNTLSESTNVPRRRGEKAEKTKEKEEGVKEKEKWWSIGRERRVSKDGKKLPGDENADPSKGSSNHFCFLS